MATSRIRHRVWPTQSDDEELFRGGERPGREAELSEQVGQRLAHGLAHELVVIDDRNQGR
jgi:hypothetical protein